jgi:hypothetical protein
MLTTKKVIEEAIKVRSDKIQVLEKQMDDDLEGLDHVFLNLQSKNFKPK